MAAIDLDSDTPRVAKPRLKIRDDRQETYHVDWSPDSRYLSFSRGPASDGTPARKGTFVAACEMIGVLAPGWNICSVASDNSGVLDLNTAPEGDVVRVTNNGLSNKESAWLRQRATSK